MEALPDTPLKPPRSTDPQAEFIDRHQAELWRYLRFLGCPHEQAEDFLQDAFLVALERDVPELARHAAAQWLRTTVRNLFLMELRKKARQPSRVAMDVEELDAAWPACEDRIHDHLAALEHCLPALDPRERRAIALRYRLGYSRDEMAHDLGMSPSGVKSLLRRIRRHLQREVERTIKEKKR